MQNLGCEQDTYTRPKARLRNVAVQKPSGSTLCGRYIASNKGWDAAGRHFLRLKADTSNTGKKLPIKRAEKCSKSAREGAVESDRALLIT